MRHLGLQAHGRITLHAAGSLAGAPDHPRIPRLNLSMALTAWQIKTELLHATCSKAISETTCLDGNLPRASIVLACLGGGKADVPPS